MSQLVMVFCRGFSQPVLEAFYILLLDYLMGPVQKVLRIAGIILHYS